MSDVSSTRSIQAKLADLHIFVVPVDQWLDKYRTAFNNIALESVSAGFVRVHPDLSLHHLRECLEEQLGEEIVPEEFIFLRSVGRCMAVVKENQERLLKVKDFLPPIAYSPEIFLLPGNHDTYARPATDSSNVVVATQGHTTAGMSSTNPFHLPLINNQNLVTQTGYINPQGYHGNYPGQEEAYQSGRHSSMPENMVNGVGYQVNKLQQSQQDSFDSDKINSSQEDNDSGHPDNDMRHLSDDLDDVELTPRRQKQDKSSRESKSKKNKQTHNGELENNRAASPVEHEVKTVKIIEPQVVHSMPYQGPDGHLVAPPTPIPSGRVIASPMPGPRKKESKKNKKIKAKQKSRSRSTSLDRGKVKNADDLDKMAELPSDSYVIPDIVDVEERSKYAQFPSPAKSTRSQRPYETEMDSRIATDELNTPPQHINNSLNNSKKEKDESSLQRQNGMDKTDEDIYGKRDEKDENILGNNEDNLAFATNTNQDKNSNNNAGKTNEKQSKTITRKPKKTVKKTVKKPPQDDLDEKLKKLKQAAPPPIAVPDPGSVSFEKDTHSAKDRKQKIIEDLRGQLRKAKNERVDLEKQRDQKVRKAKTLQTQTLQKRNQSKNIWKKKFFDEKRKTAPLEEQLNRLRYDVEVQHKAIVDLLETKDRDGGKGGKDQDRTPSEKTNQLMLLARAQNEVEDLRHKIEELKVKLASEMKLRDNAQRELKQLREDLIEKKINLTLTKSQKSLVVLNTAENIAAQ